MRASHSVPAGLALAPSSCMNSHTVKATAAVVAIHIALLAVILTVRNEPAGRPLESRTMTAELLSPAPVAAPAALQSIAPPPPKPTPPVPHVKPKVQPRPQSAVRRWKSARPRTSRTSTATSRSPTIRPYHDAVEKPVRPDRQPREHRAEKEQWIRPARRRRAGRRQGKRL
jgi:protein TonB